jgi:hypothetical protein
MPNSFWTEVTIKDFDHNSDEIVVDFRKEPSPNGSNYLSIRLDSHAFDHINLDVAGCQQLRNLLNQFIDSRTVEMESMND